MNDTAILQALSTKIASLSSAGLPSVGALARHLEILFEGLNKRSPRLHRAFYDFWNAAEVISVACMEEKRSITERESEDAAIKTPVPTSMM